MNIYQDPRKLNELTDAMTRHRNVISDVTNAQSRLAQKLNMLDRSAADYSKQVERINREYDKLEKKKTVATRSLRAWEKLRGVIQNVQDEVNKVGKRMDDMASASTKSVAEYVSHTKQISKVFRAELDQLKARKVIGESMYKALMSYEDKLHDKAMKNASERTKLLHTMRTGTRGERKEAYGKWGKEVFGEKALGGVAGGLVGAVGIKSKTLGAMGGAFKGGYGSMESVREGFKEFKAIAEDAGGGILKLSGGLKALGNALKGLNWIGMLVGTIRAAVSAVNELDKFMKDLNKSWMTMAGSTVLMKDVSKSMADFNKAIFDVGRNMRLGLQEKDITGFFKAMSTGGLSLEGIAKRAGGYNQAIEEGFKLSKQFGVSFSEMGQMMSRQMMNLRSSLDDVSDAFKGLSYDAAMAGVNSQKFYQIVENVSTSLSFYGNYLKSTSDMLRTFSETGLMGFKDASETVQTLMGSIKGMGMDQRRQLVNILGEDEVKRMMDQRVAEMDQAIQEQKSIVRELEGGGGPKTEGAKKELEAARTRLHAAEMDKRNLQEAARRGDLTGMAGMLDVLSDDVMKMAYRVMEKFNVDFFEDKAAAYEVLSKTMGWNLDTVNKAMKRANATFSLMEEEIGHFETIMNDAVQGSALSDVASDVNLFFNHPKLSPIKSLEDLLSEARGKLKAGGIGADELERILSLIREGGPVFMHMVNRVEEVVAGKQAGKKAGTKWSEKEYKAISQGEVKDWASRVAAVVTAGKEAEVTDRRMEELVKQTTPIAKYLDIGKENVKFALASSDFMASISVATAETAKRAGSILQELIGLFRFLTKRKRGEQEERFVSAETHAAARYKQLQIQQYTGGELLEAMKRAGADEKAIKSVSASLSTGREQIAEIEKKYSLIPSILEEVRREARMSADEQLASVHKQKEEIKELGKLHRAVMSAPEATEGGVYSQMQLERAREGAAEAYNLAVRGLNADLKKLGKSATGAYGGTAANKRDPDFANRLVESLGAKTKAGYRSKIGFDEAADALFGEEQDFLVKRGGLVNLKRGDMAIDSSSLAKGLGMGAGQLMNYGPGIMRGGAAGGLAMNGVTLNFNAPMEGKPEEYRRVFVEAVEDVVNRMKYKDEMRV